MLSAITRRSVGASLRRSLSTSAANPYYVPTLTERRPGEAGTGGRASEAGLKVAVFGASGFLGHYVCAELGANGFMGYLANRGDDMEMRHLKPNFELGRSRFVFYSPRDRDSIKDVIADADIVVNMIGKYYESGQPVQVDKFPYVKWRTNYSFQEANVDIAYTIADVCKELQVDYMIHVSSASASPDAVSEWSRTKYEGEMAVKEAYPWATIIRPTQFFGRQDRFLNWFGRIAKWYRFVPLLEEHKDVLTQPVWVGDVAKTILRVCDDPNKFVGRSIDCFGPAEFTYPELATFVNDITERNRKVVYVPKNIYRKMASILQNQRNPLLTPDLVDVWSQDFLPRMTAEEYAAQPEDANKILTMADLDIDAMPVEKEAFDYLHFYREGGRFFRVRGYHLQGTDDAA